MNRRVYRSSIAENTDRCLPHQSVCRGHFPEPIQFWFGHKNEYDTVFGEQPQLEESKVSNGRFAEYSQFDALGLADLVVTGQLNPAELLDEALARADEHNANLNAIVLRLDDLARQSIADGLPQGPFHGVPFLLKDLSNALAGVKRSSGCRFFADYVPNFDSELVRRYKAAGLNIFGKTNTPEFGMTPMTDPELFGSARNPWNIERTPGGSSGGTAAAIAAGIVPMANGGDGGGSIRMPASCCGLVGLKPTRARTPVGPEMGENWFGLAIEHVLTRSVRDCAAALDATAGPEMGAPYAAPPAPDGGYLKSLETSPRKLKIAYSTASWLGRGLDAECVAGVEATAKLLEGLGHDVVEADPGVDREEFIFAMGILVASDAAVILQAGEKLMGRKATRADVEGNTWALAKLGHTFSAAELQAAVAYMRYVGQRMAEFMQGYDVLLMSTLGMPPAEVGALRPKGVEKLMLSLINNLPLGSIAKQRQILIGNFAPVFDWMCNTPIANATGAPSISLPLHWTGDNLPVGMMFTGRFGDEATLLQLAKQLEDAQPWFGRRPPGY